MNVKDRLRELMEDKTPANAASKVAERELHETGKTTYRGKTYTMPGTPIIQEGSKPVSPYGQARGALLQGRGSALDRISGLLPTGAEAVAPGPSRATGGSLLPTGAAERINALPTGRTDYTDLIAERGTAQNQLSGLRQELNMAQRSRGMVGDRSTKEIRAELAETEKALAALEEREQDIPQEEKRERWIELAALDRPLTSAERAEARAAIQELRGDPFAGALRTLRGETEDQKDRVNLADALETRVSGRGAAAAGLVAEVPFLGKAAEAGVDKASEIAEGAGVANPYLREGANVYRDAPVEHPGAYQTGRGVMSLAELTLLNGGAEKATGAVPGFKGLPRAAQNAIRSGLTFGAKGALDEASAGGDHGEIAKAGLIRGAAAAAGSGASDLAGKLGTGLLFKTGLQNAAPAVVLRDGLAGTAFAGANMGTTMALDPEYRPSGGEAAKDLAVAFAFSTLSSLAQTNARTQEAKARLEQDVNAMKQDYTAIVGGADGKVTAAALDDLAARSARMRETLGTTQYVGQQETVSGVYQFLDQLDDVVAGARANVSGLGESVVAGTTAAPPTPGELMRAGQVPVAVQAGTPEAGAAPVAAGLLTGKDAVQTQKSAPAEAEAESTAVNTNPALHTAAEQTVIEEYQGAVDDGLLQYYEAARTGQTKGPYFLKPVQEQAAQEIERLVGRDVRGFRTRLDARQAEHISLDHGEQGRADHSMGDPNDIARIQFILDNYDAVSDGGQTDAYWEPKPNGKNRQAKVVVFSKKVNGTYYVVEAAPVSKAKSVYIVSAYMLKDGGQGPGRGGKSTKTEGVTQPPDASAPWFTANTDSAHTPSVLDSTIPQTGQGVKAQDAQRIEAVSGGKPLPAGEDIHIDERTWADAGKRKVNAFQYDHPELHGFYAEAARGVLYDLQHSVKGERMPVKDADGYITGYTGTSRMTSSAVEMALDDAGLSYGQIEKALQNLIADHGQENYAAAKKVELVLDTVLSEGYTDVDGVEHAADEAYLSAKNLLKAGLDSGRSDYRMSEEEWAGLMDETPVDSGRGGAYDESRNHMLPGGELNARGAEAEVADVRGVYGADVRGQAEGTDAGGRSPYIELGEEVAGKEVGRRVADWAVGHVVEHPENPAAVRAVKRAAEYAPDIAVVEDAILKERVPGVWALTSNGVVHLSDSMPESLENVVPYHEAVHALKQNGSTEYQTFLADLGGQLNYRSTSIAHVLEIILRSRFKGKDLMELSDPELNVAYDELNAIVWGYHKADPENARAQFADVFTDYDAYIAELDAIMEGARRENQGNPVGPEASVGAAPMGFDDYSHMQNQKSEFHPDGEKAYRQVDVPTTDLEGKRISKSAATVMEAQAIPDAMIGEIQQMVADGKFSYRRNTDAGAIQRAQQLIQKIGWDGAVERFHQQAQNGVVSKDLMSLGATLLDNAANSRDGEAMALILADYSSMSRAGAQATQANRLLKKMSPQWQLAAVQRAVDDLNQARRDKRPDAPTAPETPGGSTLPGGEKTPGGAEQPGGREPGVFRPRQDNNIPVEEWMQRTGELLAEKLERTVRVPKPKVKTTVDTILGDLVRYAKEHVQTPAKSGKPRSNMDRIQDLFDNYENYKEAWDAAKATAKNEFGDSPDVMAALDEWMDSALDYGKPLTRELTEQDAIQISPELVEKFLSSEAGEARDAVLDEIYQNIADQVPSTWIDKWNAWRYLAMLGNLRTHVRNIVGNAGFAPVRMLKNEVGAALEAFVGAAPGGKVGRSKSFVFSRDLYQAALEDFQNVRDMALGGKKYDDASGVIQDKRTVFKNNGTWGTGAESPAASRTARKATGALWTGLEAARKFNTWALDAEDLFFSKAAYADSLAGYLNAHGVTAAALREGKVDAGLLDQARAYAIEEAQKATYRDSNAFSEWVSQLGGRTRRSTNPVVKGLGVLGEGILPFKKTPANILVRGVEYSPAGLVKGVVETFQAARGKGDMTGALDSLAAGLTGTGLFALGAVLAAIGAVSGGGSGDDDQDRLDDLVGKQNYAARLPDGTSVTMDWLAPEALPFFMGVEYANLGADGGFQFKDLCEAGMRLTDPLLEMSMLQSINDIMSKRSYQDTGLGEVVASALSSYLTQGLPTVAGQIERTGDEVRMTTYPDKNGALPTGAQYVLGKIGNKIPGWDYRQIPYIDAWGRTESNGSVGERAFNNFLNPAFTSKENVTELDKEVQRLYGALGDGGVVPDRAAKYVTVSGERTDLDQDQYVKYATKKGKTAYNTASTVIGAELYDGLTDNQKAEVVKAAYSYADAVAKLGLGVGYEPDKWVLKAREMSGEDRADFLIIKEVLGDAGETQAEKRAALVDMDGLTDKEKAGFGMSVLGDKSPLDYSDEDALTISLMSDSGQEKAERARSAGISDSVFLAVWEAQKNVQGDKGADGKTIDYSLSRNKKEAIDEVASGLSVEQRRLLYELFDVSRSVWGLLPTR